MGGAPLPPRCSISAEWLHFRHVTALAAGGLYKMAAPRALAAARRAVAAAARGRRSAGTGAAPRGPAERSRLYEHVREGLSARPQLDMAALSTNPAQAARDLELRKGPLREGELREIVSGGSRAGREGAWPAGVGGAAVVPGAWPCALWGRGFVTDPAHSCRPGPAWRRCAPPSLALKPRRRRWPWQCTPWW